jgi:hypothetical protein
MSTKAGLLKAASAIYELPSIHSGSGSGFGGSGVGVRGGFGSTGYSISKALSQSTIFKFPILPLNDG